MAGLTDDDRRAVAAAIAETEQTTSGEIYCIVARASADYREVPLAWAALAALVPPLLAAGLGWTPWWPQSGWAVQAGAGDVTRALLGYAAVQAALFALTAALVSIPAVKAALTPAPLKRARVRRAAVELFLTHGLHATEARTGVLLYASLAERRVEVVADETIHRQVDAEVWGDAAAALTASLSKGRIAAGFTEAVRLCGAVLAERFPPSAANRDELPNRVVEI